eukprot:gene4809-5273_t
MEYVRLILSKWSRRISAVAPLGLKEQEQEEIMMKSTGKTRLVEEVNRDASLLSLPDPSILSSLINQGNATMCSEEDLRLLMEDDEKDRKKRRRRGGGGSAAGKHLVETCPPPPPPPPTQVGSHEDKPTRSAQPGRAKHKASTAASSSKLPSSSSSSQAQLGHHGSGCPALVRDDPRVHYPRHLIRAFNSCDPRFLQETLEKYCEPSVLGMYRYDGVKDPNGSSHRECDGIDGNMTLWTSLFRSAPDFIFRLLDLHVTVDQESACCIVSSSFDMHGTRIRDIKHVQEGKASSEAGEVSHSDTPSPQQQRSEAANSSRRSSDDLMSEGGGDPSIVDFDTTAAMNIYSLDRDSLLRLPQTTPEIVDLLCLYEIEDFMREAGFDVGGDSRDDNNKKEPQPQLDCGSLVNHNRQTNSDIPVSVNKSIFAQRPGEAVVRITKHVKLAVDLQPLRERVRLMYKGNFLVYINAEDKIFKFEFIYKVNG